ncbi:MAG TPA: AAA family ATPase [Candidatus Dormibacteraeota bacterium]|nr:AAA family ATPase [Candidatus Dormibacteraeota bacterium]
MGTGTADLHIRIPAGALVLLIGPSGSGKSTFASRQFDANAVISSDRLRGLLAGDEGDQHATDAAFDRLHRWLDWRLAAGALAVVDATNVEWMRRTELISRARQYGRTAIAIVFDLPLDLCLARSAARQRRVSPSVIRRQHADLRHSLDRLELEGFTGVHILRNDAEVNRVAVGVEKGPAARALSTDD